MSNRRIRCPNLMLPMKQSRAAELELRIDEHTQENWELFALLKDVRVLHALLIQLAPELQAYNLLAQNSLLTRLLEMLDNLPSSAHSLYLTHTDRYPTVLTDSLYSYDPFSRTRAINPLFSGPAPFKRPIP